jgi:hypothetical protein
MDRAAQSAARTRLFFLLIPCWESQRLIPKRSAGPRATKIGVVSLKALDHHRPNREDETGVNHSLSVFPLLIRAHRLGRRNRWSFWLQISSRLKTKARQKASASTVSPARCMSNGKAALTPLGQLPFHRFSESGRPVRRFRCGLPSTLYEPKRAKKTRRVGNDNAVDVVWAQALCSHSGAPFR